ncbi:MAG: hypothetical protein UGE23_01970 [Peptococcaceae bacterium]|nr:hypothetical protein [Peptococcaceae bacterium]
MSIRKGYIYALLLAIGLFLWTNVAETWQKVPAEESAAPVVVSEEEEPWTSTEALYECSMKAQELGLTVESMHTASDTLQGSLVLRGEREKLQAFYIWLEDAGRFHAIQSFQFRTEDETSSSLSLSYQL